MTPEPIRIEPLEPDSISVHPLSPSILVIAGVVILLIGTAAWVAGVQYGKLKSQQVVADLTNAQAQGVQLATRLGEREAQLRRLNDTVKVAGTGQLASRTEDMRRQILRLQAELSDMQSASERDQAAKAMNDQLTGTLSEPGVRFLSLRSIEPTASLAYALILENRKLTLVVSNLQKAQTGRCYELWITRKQEPEVVSAGVIIPDDNGRALLEFSDVELVSMIMELSITDEPAEGTAAPTGTKLFTSLDSE